MTLLTCSEVVFLLHCIMAEPLPVQHLLQARAQEVPAHIHATSQAPLPVLPAPQGPTAPASEAAGENADTGN